MTSPVKYAERGFWALGYQFWALARPYWFGPERWGARGRLALLLLLLVAETRCNVLFNEQSGELTSALAALDKPRLWKAIQLFLTLAVVAIPIYGYYYLLRDYLALLWRRSLTRRVLDGYMEQRRYYELNSVPALDNPDQRISEDISAFTQRSLSFLFLGVSALMQVIAFSHVLWSISRPLVLFLVGYAALGTGVTMGVFGKRLIELNVQQLRREADFRFGMVRVRENAEAIAFYRGETREVSTLWSRFGEVFGNYRELIRQTLKLSLFQRGYGLLALALPTVVVAPRVLSGELEVGAVVQATGAFAAILASLTLLIDNFENLSRFAAGIERLSRFVGFIAGAPPSERAMASNIESTEGPVVALENVTLKTPNHERTLVESLSLTVERGNHLLIVGVSGGGKSSLLRAIAGLWHAGAGRIVRPPAEQLLFIPQHPYMVLGSLRSQMLYPGDGRSVADDELKRVLEQVNLPNLVQQCGGLDAEIDFSKVLSTGEQQRLGFARVLLTKPSYLILDEATSALDPENEAALYRLLGTLQVTLISVSHRPATLQYHTQVLELTGNANWRVQPAQGYVFNRDFAVD
jgi:vitamin B12/bleomycin/antimicrobial peptide transport system ATP-binding/permease protein